MTLFSQLFASEYKNESYNNLLEFKNPENRILSLIIENQRASFRGLWTVENIFRVSDIDRPTANSYPRTTLHFALQKCSSLTCCTAQALRNKSLHRQWLFCYPEIPITQLFVQTLPHWQTAHHNHAHTSICVRFPRSMRIHAVAKHESSWKPATHSTDC